MMRKEMVHPDDSVPAGVCRRRPEGLMELESMHPVGPDGWTEWTHPARGPVGAYLMGCCDCGLRHEVQFEIVEDAPGAGRTYWPGEGPEYIIWRMRRAPLFAIPENLANPEVSDVSGRTIYRNVIDGESYDLATGEPV